MAWCGLLHYRAKLLPVASDYLLVYGFQVFEFLDLQALSTRHLHMHRRYRTLEFKAKVLHKSNLVLVLGKFE